MSQQPPPLPQATGDDVPAPVETKRIAGMTPFAWILFIGLLAILFFQFKSTQRAPARISLSEFSGRLQKAEFVEVVVEEDVLRATLHSPFAVPTPGTPQPTGCRVDLAKGMGANWGFVSWLLQNRNGANIRLSNDESLLATALVPLIPWLLIFAFIWFFVFRQLRQHTRQPQQPVRVILVNPENSKP